MSRKPVHRVLLVLLAALLVAGCGGGTASTPAGPGSSGNEVRAALAPPPPPTLPVGETSLTQRVAVADASPTLSLAPGWNLVSFPVAQVTSVTPGEGLHPTMFAYDPGAGTYRAVAFTPEAINADGGPGRGFWVLSTGAGTVAYEGTGTPTAAALLPGWNLVGMPPSSPVDVDVEPASGERRLLASAACAQIPAPAGCLLYRNAFAFGAGGGYEPSDLGSANTAFPGGQGYWIFAHAPLTLRFPTGSLQALEVAPVSAALPLGSTFQFTATGLYSDGSVRDLTPVAQWTSSEPGIAAVDTQGLVTGVALGRAEISASVAGRTAWRAGFVTEARPERLELSPAAMTLPKGATQALVATLVYTDGTREDVTARAQYDFPVYWVAERGPTSASVRAKAVGTARVTASYDAFSATSPITVTPVEPLKLEIQYAPFRLPAGYARRTYALVTFSDGSVRDVTAEATWNTSNGSATVVAGSVQGVAAGSCDLTAAWQGFATSVPLSVTSATLQTLQVETAPRGVPVGSTAPGYVLGNFSDGSVLDLTGQVTWSSENEAVAAVSNAPATPGQVTGVSQGQAVIRATRGAVTGAKTVSVTAPTPVSLAVEPGSPSMPANTVLQLRAIATMSDGSTTDYTARVRWSSSNQRVAKVDDGAERGLLTAFEAGSATVSVYDPLQPLVLGGSTTVQVTGAELVALRISPPAVEVPDETWVNFTALAVFADGTSRDYTSFVTWTVEGGIGAMSSSTPGYAGFRTPGVGVVRARLGDLQATANVTVTAGVLKSITLGPAGPRTGVGGGVQLTCTGSFSDYVGQDLANSVSWTSSDPSVVEVRTDPDRAGYVVGVAPGTATVRATHLATGKSASLAVTVSDAALESLALTPADRLLHLGRLHTLKATGTWADGTTADLTPLVTWSCDRFPVRNSARAEGQVTPHEMGSAAVQATHPGSGLVATGTLRVATFDQYEEHVPIGEAAALCADAQGRHLYVLDTEADEVVAVDLTSREVFGRIPVGAATSMDLTADGRTLLLADPGANSIMRVHVPELEVSSFPTGSSMQLVQLTAGSGQRALVTLKGGTSWEIAEYDVGAGTKVGTHLTGSGTTPAFQYSRANGKLFLEYSDYRVSRYDASVMPMVLEGSRSNFDLSLLSPDGLILRGLPVGTYPLVSGFYDALNLNVLIGRVDFGDPSDIRTTVFSAESDLIFASVWSVARQKVYVGDPRQSAAMLDFDIRMVVNRLITRMLAVPDGRTLVLATSSSQAPWRGELYFVAVRR